MASILMKKFTVRYQGENYGPGSVISSMPDELAKKLVSESNGSIEYLPVPEEKADGNPQAVQALESNGLPPVDPSKTVK